MTTKRRSRELRGVWFKLALTLAIALPLVAWTAHAASVASVILSPSTVAPGSSSTGTVGLDAVAANNVTVQLASTNNRIATVPASVIVGAGKMKRSFTVTTFSGAGGCAEISAQVGTTPRLSELLIVRPNVPSSALKLTLPSFTVSGNITSGSITIFPAPAGPTVVQLSSNTSLATVPASVTAQVVSGGDIGDIGAASFPITTSVFGYTYCPVITATMTGASTKGLFKVISIGG